MFLPHVFLFLAAASSLGATGEWPQFRGPAGDGHSPASETLPVAFSETGNVRWKVPIHGKGWSSPVIQGSQIWLTTATEDGTALSAVCIDRETGKPVHDRVIFKVDTPQFCHRFNSYASPTPVVEGSRVYVTFGSPGTACLDAATGRTIWERTDFVCNHFRGAGSSPIVWEDLLILHFDGSDFQFVVALDKATGKTVWKTDRSVDHQDLGKDGKPEAEGDMRKAFATPHVVQHGGKPVLLSSGAKAHYGYDPRTGRELWRFEERAQHSASTRPIAGGGIAYFPTGFSKGQLVAVKMPEAGTGAAKVLGDGDLAWRVKKSVSNKPSLLLHDGLIFMTDDGGITSCLDAATGAEIWKNRVQGNFSASPVLAAGRIYVCSEEGKVAVLAAGREWKVLGENHLGDGFMASPAIAGNALFLRSRTHLYKVEAP